MAPWRLPLVVAAIAVPIAAAFYAGGPGVGVAVGALVAVALVVVAVRDRPRGTIGGWPGESGDRRLLVVVSRPVEDAATVAAIATAAGDEGRGEEPAEVLLLAPARIGFLARWASDLEDARREAQQNLVISVASLAKAGVPAEARVGDADLVQAVEDTLQGFVATDVILVTSAAGSDPEAASAATELEARLRARFQVLVVSDPAAR